VTVAEFQRPLQSEKSWVDHPQDRVRACEVIPRNGVLGYQPNQPAVELKGTRVLAGSSQIVPVDPQGIDEERVPIEDPPEKINLEVQLALLA
jgi:hypothetical protein